MMVTVALHRIIFSKRPHAGTAEHQNDFSTNDSLNSLTPPPHPTPPQEEGRAETLKPTGGGREVGENGMPNCPPVVEADQS